ncbi:MAG: SUMF1/EgtB/PvdO family nonheme iron enzyme [Bacteroidota bacterium]
MKTKIPVLIILCIFCLSAKNKNYGPLSLKNYVHVFDNIYASKYEVTNEEYRLFLEDLNAQGKAELYKECAIDTSRWTEVFPYGYIDPMKKFYHCHPAYSKYPVVNISYDAATEYCKWLTEKYSKLAENKGKKIIFRLPKQVEWYRAADPLPDNFLPWYGYSAYNMKGEYLANIKFQDGWTDKSTNYIADGSFFPSIVGYFPANRTGIYDIIGNVAEMIEEEGVYMGGSWDDFIEDCKTNVIRTFDKPDPRIGFRVFMEIGE